MQGLFATATTPVPWLPALTALFGVLITLLGKWWTDRRVEYRKAAAELAGALAELKMHRDEVVRQGLENSFKEYEAFAESGEFIPLVAPLKEEMFPITQKSLETAGVLGRKATEDLTAIYFRATAVISTMKSIQALLLAPGQSIDDSRRTLMISTLFGLASRQVAESVMEYDQKCLALEYEAKKKRRW
ncbi:hypothetical protein [Stenotrophomonas sp. PS02298]|uniref:hypothetical protein n=1 Tax=Stenotrophomonas sp. PS02298 TaxID=2991424 RepID=UPI00249BBEEE|nr:hypothetical protein [Stenotrophomonas sp. PS02298]